MGWGVAEKETFAHQIVDGLVESGRKVDGLQSRRRQLQHLAGTRLFREVGARLKPDIIVLAYFINDAEPMPQYSSDGWLSEHSAAWVVAGYRIDSLFRHVRRSARLEALLSRRCTNQGAGLAETRKRSARFAATARGLGAELVVFNIPELRELKPYPFADITAKVRTVVERERVPFVDLLPTVENLEPSSLWVTVPDPHPNGKAKSAFARGMIPKISAMLDDLCASQARGASRLRRRACARGAGIPETALIVHPARAQPVKNIVLALASVVFSLVVAEAAVRYIDGYAMFEFPLNKPVGSMTAGQELVDQIPLASSVEREWFLSDPPALPNRRAVPNEWRELSRFVEDNSAASAGFQSLDLFKAWNSAFAGDPCKQSLLRQAPGRFFTYDPPDGNATPPYRYLPDATFPSGLVTNQVGWRGAPIENPRGEKTVRIVVVGSSTVARRPAAALLLAGICRALAQPLGQIETFAGSLRGVERRTGKHRVDRHRRRGTHRSPAIAARSRRVQRGRQPVPSGVHR